MGKLDDIVYSKAYSNPTIDSDDALYSLNFYKDVEYLAPLENFVSFVKSCEKLVRISPDYKKYIACNPYDEQADKINQMINAILSELINNWLESTQEIQLNEILLKEPYSSIIGLTNKQTNRLIQDCFVAKMKEEFAKRAVQKQDLIAQAKLCVAQVDFSNEMVEKVKSLRTQWKEIGTCGRNKEDALWNEFNETVNTFFKNMKDYK